jgi:hypothetical protein
LSVGGDRAVDDRRLERADVVVTETQAVHHAGPVVLDDDIGGLDERAGLLDIAGILQIERDRALVAIERGEVLAVAVGDGRPRAQRIAALRMLDLDDIGAHVRQQHAAIRPGGDVAKLDDPDSLKRLIHSLSPASLFGGGAPGALTGSANRAESARSHCDATPYACKP